jgi:2-succinyl-5-enolpyruvyl-6-hydroxy-3-cyclohexene-1-carboxylate synthase
MYTNQKNAQIVLALLKQHNIKYIVVSPGSTNIPIVHGLEIAPYFTCYSVVDERSAIRKRILRLKRLYF